MSDNEKTFNATAARQLLKDEQTQRETTCAAAIQAILAEHGCNLLAVARLTQDGRVAAELVIRSASDDART